MYQAIDLLCSTTQTTIGIPSSEVTTFIGISINFEKISHISIAAMPHRSVAGISERWSASRIIILATCGIASPTNPIGPQNAVTDPTSKVVAANISNRLLCRFRPIVFAYSSPSSSRLSGFMVKTDKISPAATEAERIASWFDVTSLRDPMVQTTNVFSASS